MIIIGLWATPGPGARPKGTGNRLTWKVDLKLLHSNMDKPEHYEYTLVHLHGNALVVWPASHGQTLANSCGK